MIMAAELTGTDSIILHYYCLPHLSDATSSFTDEGSIVYTLCTGLAGVARYRYSMLVPLSIFCIRYSYIMIMRVD